jgi:hypothetical protein
MTLKDETIKALRNLFIPIDSSVYLDKIEAVKEVIINHPEILAMEGYQKTEWVSVEDEFKPDGKEDVLCLHKQEYVTIGFYENFNNRFRSVESGEVISNITHFMPIPSAPNKK